MKNFGSPKGSEKYKKPSSATALKRGFVAGLFSSQNSLFSSVLSTKGKDQSSKSQKHKTSQTQCEFSTYRSETPNQAQQKQQFALKYHLSTNQSKAQKKKGNLLNKETIQSRFNNLLCQNKSADFEKISFKAKDSEDNEIASILTNLKYISEQMNSAKLASLNYQILLSWQTLLTQNCEKLTLLLRKSELSTPQKIMSKESLTFHQDSSIVLEKLLAEERRNRLVVEEQTSKIIQSQEAEIKSYIDKIRQLEQRLLEKAHWRK